MRVELSQWWLVSTLSCLVMLGCGKTNFSGASQTAKSASKPEDSIPPSENAGPTAVEQAAASAGPQDSTSPDPENGVVEEALFKDVVEGSVPGGLSDGHFDLDTAIRNYEFKKGKTEAHTHAYDDKFNLAGVDFFDIKEREQVEIDEAIADPAARFTLVVVNASLSSYGMVNVNGQVRTVEKFSSEWKTALVDGKPAHAFTLGAPSVPGDVQLSKLMLAFAPDAITKNGIIASNPGVVRPNDPGPNGEYRAGALVVQAIAIDTLKIDPATGAATIGDGGLLWEGMVYYHKKDDGD